MVGVHTVCDVYTVVLIGDIGRGTYALGAPAAGPRARQLATTRTATRASDAVRAVARAGRTESVSTSRVGACARAGGAS